MTFKGGRILKSLKNLKFLGQESSNLAHEIHFPAEFSSNLNQTHLSMTSGSLENHRWVSLIKVHWLPIQERTNQLCHVIMMSLCHTNPDNQGLCSFQALRAKFCLPASAYFVFLQLRSALKAYGVPWSSSISSHPMRDWIAPSAGRPSVSLIYNKIIDCITKPLSIKTIWNTELSDLNLSVDWERVWSNLSLTSKNLAHRLIHFKVIHRAYITSYKRFKMKLQSNLNCHICNTTSSGTFLHMFWECPVVISLWTYVNLVLSSLLRIDWSVNPSLCLLNDDSGLCISSMQKRMLFAGFTAVKKTIIQNWFTPHMCREAYWIRSLLQIVSCECTTARVGGARPSTIEAWQCFLLNIRDYLKE